MQKYITAKFGGSSLADASGIKYVAELIKSDSLRKYIVVSAPGKRNKTDKKITELLLECGRFPSRFKTIEKRFVNITRNLRCQIPHKQLKEIHEGIITRKSRDWIASRGEWLMAQILAEYLGATFIDAARIIRLESNGEINPRSHAMVTSQLKGSRQYIIPGFYGSLKNGQIKTFPRGGSDITGALIAKYTGCHMYENWTNVEGVFTAQPALVSAARPLPSLTFREMRELGYRGAEVVQRDALLPLIKLGVPIHVKSTFRPQAAGTFIIPKRQVLPDELIVGIAGRGGFTSIQIQKFGMNEQTGALEKITFALKKNHISFEHNPTGLDSVSIILAQKEVIGKKKAIIKDIQEAIRADSVSFSKKDLALICLVGEGLIKNHLAHTTAASLLFQTLSKAKIQIYAIISATAGIDIVVAVDERNLHLALNKLHEAFFK